MNFAPLTDAEWPAEIADMRDGFAGQLNVYRLMAHHPDLLRAWADLRMHVVRNNALGRQRAEVVILRLACRLDCDYEWGQHVIRGLDAGLSDAQIRSMRGSVLEMAPDDALLAGAVDALVDNARLSPDQMKAIEAVVGRKGLLDLMATVGMYLTLGFLLKSTNGPQDDDITQRLADLPAALAMPG